jgi:hexosaminidase
MKTAEYMAFPRMLALAELTWTPKELKNYADFIRRVKLQEKRFDAAEVNYRKIEPPSSLD